MAENVMGGLSGAMPPEAEAPAQKPSFDNYLAKVQKQQQDSFNALNERRQRLLELGSARQQQTFNPQLLALSAALGRPTKTGSFGESLGYAAEALGAEQEKQLQREQVEAKMQYEIEQATQDQRRKILDSQLMMSLFGQGGEQSGMPANNVPAGGMPAGATAGVPAAGMPPTSTTAKTLTPIAGASRLESLTDEQLMALSDARPEIAKTVLSILDNRRKQKEIGFKEKEIGFKEREVAAKETSVKRFLPGVGSIEMPITFWKELESAPNFESVSEIYKKYNLPINLVDTDGGNKRFMSEGEIANKNKGVETTVTERAKSSEESRKSILERGDQSPNMINTADAIYTLASDPATSGAFGVLAKPGVKAAIATAISEGIRVGNFSVGFPAIEDVIRKIGGTQKEIDAALMAARFSADLELGFRRTFLAGQGSVSNMEAEVTRRLGGGISDSPKIAMAKSETIKARALFDQKAAELLQDWEDKNPNKNAYAFKRSPEYKDLVENYSSHLNDLMGKYFQISGGAPTPSKLKSNRTTKSLLDQIRAQ